MKSRDQIEKSRMVPYKAEVTSVSASRVPASLALTPTKGRCFLSRLSITE